MRGIFFPIYIERNGTGERYLKATGELCALNQPRRGFGVPNKKSSETGMAKIEKRPVGQTDDLDLKE